MYEFVWIEEENRDVEGGEEENESQFIRWRKGGLSSEDKKSQRAGPGWQQLTIKSATSLVFLWWADEMIIIFFGVKDEDL